MMNEKELNKLQEIKRGDILFVHLSDKDGIGSEQKNDRFAICVQNDVANRYSPTIIVAFITSRLTKQKLPVHLEIPAGNYGLSKDSVILFEQIRTLDKRRIISKVGHIDDELLLKKVDNAIDISMKALKPKSLLEKLPDEIRNFIIATLKHIKKLDITVSEMKEAELEKDIIDLMINKKLSVLNKFIKYCTEHQIDYKNFYIVNKGVSDEIAL